MCGFAGVVTWDERYRVSPETLGKMSAAIAHRGPDGQGSYINHQEKISPDHPQVALAFRRLAILDPDPRSNQPFTDGRHWLVFNGEIYNFRELKKELSSLRPDYHWRTTGDTEVLLCAYAVWGEKCVEHLNGMFAFVVWDEVEKSLFLARDRMGQKPLFWARTGWSDAIAFASEISALKNVPWFQPTLDHSDLQQYLAWGYIGGHSTAFRMVGRMTPAGRLFFSHSEKKRNLSRDDLWYFDPNKCNNIVSDASALDSTKGLIRSAVQRQLVSDVPVGCFLSGGIDSSVIAMAMKSAAPADQPVHTFSLGFDDSRYDETPYARAVATHLGTVHHELKVKADVTDDLTRLATVFGEPFADSSVLPTHYLSRETKRYVKVALSGDGGDELFGGYDRYRGIRIAARTQMVPLFLRRAFARPWDGPARGHPKSISSKLARFLGSIDLPIWEQYQSYLRLFDDKLISALLGHTARIVLPQQNRVKQFFNDRDPAQAALACDRVQYLPNDLLTKIDRCSMLHGLEVRSPFMDHELVQFAAGLTTDQLLKGGPKRMLREAFADDLPPWVFKRKKMGFAVPIGEWFRGPLRVMLHDTLLASGSFASANFNMSVVQRLMDEHQQQRIDHSQRLYALLMLELWWNTMKSP